MKQKITFTLREEVIEILRKKSREDNRSMSNYIETLICRESEN